MTNVFFYGSSGTGKTILSAEIVKIKLSQLLEDKKTVKVIVTQYACNNCVSFDLFLMRNFKEKYFKNIEAHIVPFEDLCKELNIKIKNTLPKHMVESVIQKLAERDDEITLVMFDEVRACHITTCKVPNCVCDCGK